METTVQDKDHTTTTTTEDHQGKDPSFDSIGELFVSISGLIGAGKTTLCDALAKRLGLPAFHEEVVDTDLLQNFYSDRKRYGFLLQMSLLNQRFEQQQRIVWSKRGAVQDRSIYEDRVFANVLRESGDMTQQEYDIYCRSFDNLRRFMSHPSLIVHLDVSPEESMRRIKERGRKYEIDALTLEWLTTLRNSYERLLTHLGSIVHVIRVDYDHFPTVDAMVDVILREWAEKKKARPVSF